MGWVFVTMVWLKPRICLLFRPINGTAMKFGMVVKVAVCHKYAPFHSLPLAKANGWLWIKTGALAQWHCQAAELLTRPTLRWGTLSSPLAERGVWKPIYLLPPSLLALVCDECLKWFGVLDTFSRYNSATV